jgi:hypothetical protein
MRVVVRHIVTFKKADRRLYECKTPLRVMSPSLVPIKITLLGLVDILQSKH